MERVAYIVGEKISGGYPTGKYVCTLTPGQVWDRYVVVAVLEYPPVRAVANDEAWSNAEVKGYGEPFFFRRDEEHRRPKVYTGNLGTSEQEYNLSLVDAIERSIEEYKAKNDTEAVDRLREKLQEADEAIKTLSA